jgi:indole-3-glycerol phosphate synthase / phosphoribosylanthranilate isomerase
VKIKFCGVCRPEDAGRAEQIGAQYVGVILSPGFPRSQPIARAAEIYQAAPHTKRVGVFVNAALDDVVSAATSLQLDVVQLHGEEDAGFVQNLRQRIGGEVWKAVRVANRHDAEVCIETFAQIVDAILIDGVQDIDPVHLPEMRLIIAGGLTPHNVAREIERWNPWLADVSSGVERETGIKAADLMEAFSKNAREAQMRFGQFGGRYVPETLVAPLEDAGPGV